MRIVVSSIGTGEGKTFFARGMVRALVRRGARVAALKPFETGVGSEGALDARALERAARVPSQSFEDPSFFRAAEPLSPLAGVRRGARAPDLGLIRRAFDVFEQAFDVAVVESAGGLFVPIADAVEGIPLVFADLLRPTDRVLVVAASRLGVLSHVIACDRALRGGRFEVVLRSSPARPGEVDPSSASNAEILRSMGLTVYELDTSVDDDDELADAVERAVPLGWEKTQ